MPERPESEHPLLTRFKEINGQIKAAEATVVAGLERLHDRPDYESLTVETLEELHRVENQSENSQRILADGEWIHALMTIGLSPDIIVTIWDKKEEIHSQNKEEGL